MSDSIFAPKEAMRHRQNDFYFFWHCELFGIAIALSKYMTKKLIILAYIVGVLVLSGMVKADQSIGRGLVGKVSLRNNTNILEVTGNYPTPCHSKAHIVATQVDGTAHVIQLAVETQVATNMMCLDMVSLPFAISYDLKELPLTAGAVYSLNFKDSILKEVFQYKAVESVGMFDYKVDRQDYKGHLVNVGQTEYGLKNGNQVVRLISPDMTPSLAKYVDHDVRVTGYPVETATLNTSADEQVGGTGSTIIVPVSVSL